MKDFSSRRNFTRLRISAHNLNIELGRHRRPTKIPVEERICDTCKITEDESHYLLFCKKFWNQRETLMADMSKIFVNFGALNSENKFSMLMKCEDYEIIQVTKQFIDSTVEIRGSL